MKLLSAVLSCALAWAFASPASGQVTKSVYRLGAVLSLTGPNAPVGTQQRDVLLMVRDAVNRKGGINGHALQVVVEDDASDNTTAVKWAKKLIEQDQVAAIIGSNGTGATMAFRPIILAAGIPLVSLASGKQVTNPLARWVFRTQITDELVAARMVSALSARGIARVAVLYESDADAALGRDEFKARAATGNVQIVSEQAFPASATDLRREIAQAAKLQAQAIVCFARPQPAAAVARSLAQMERPLPLFLGQSAATLTFLTAAGRAAIGVVAIAGKLLVASDLPASDPQRRLLLQFTSDFQGSFSAPPDAPGTGAAYDALWIVTKALSRAGDDRSSLRDAIETTTNYSGVLGVYNYVPADHDGLNNGALVEVTAGAGGWKLLKK